MKTAKSITAMLIAVLAAGGLAACSGGSSGGVFNQAFNVSGHWAGTISDETGANASSGALAANYTLTGGTHAFAINRKSVNITGTRQYDGTTNIAAADISSITDTVNSEVLTMSGGPVSYTHLTLPTTVSV